VGVYVVSVVRAFLLGRASRADFPSVGGFRFGRREAFEDAMISAPRITFFVTHVRSKS
jgi:hypothetical protein